MYREKLVMSSLFPAAAVHKQEGASNMRQRRTQALPLSLRQPRPQTGQRVWARSVFEHQTRSSANRV